MKPNLVVLDLDQTRGMAGEPSEADLLRRTLDDALGALVDVLAAADTAQTATVVSTVHRCRAELAGGASARLLAPLTASCFESTRTLASAARQRAAERRAQIAAVVAMVRETVAAIAGDQTTLQETLDGSANRFENIAQSDDLQQIQERLFHEVATLRRVTMERRAAWEQTMQDLGDKLRTLESQLDHTRREASVDPLTNIANRRTFERTCQEWLGPNRPGFVMVMADVDDFKAFNDRYGHAVGDRILVAVAETLARSVRTDDLVARVGGDEFAILASSLSLRQAEGRFAAVGRSVQATCSPMLPDGAAPSISIGIAECSAGDTLDSLKERADAALYQAKRERKGRLATRPSPYIRDLRGDR